MVSVRFIRTRWKNRGETKLERKRKEARRKRLRIVVEGTRPILSDKLCIGWPPALLAGFLDQTEITFSDETWRVGENARKEQDQGQRERERLRFHDRIWQRSIISKLWSKLWTLHALCFVFELPGSIKWEEMERQVGHRRQTVFPFSLHAQGIFKRANNCGEDIERHVRANAV